MDAETMAAGLAGARPVERRRDGLWFEIALADVPSMSKMMRDSEARLVTMTARPAGEADSFDLMYHWDVDSVLVTIKVPIGMQAQSIVDLWPAADWAERETRDYYAIDFEGRDETPPLMLREGDRRGLFTNTDGVGRAADPAYTSKTGEEAR